MWKINTIGGGIPQKKGNVYSLDSKHFIQSFGRSLKVYNVSTRQCVRKISVNLEKVVDAKIDPVKPENVWFFKSTGEIVIVRWRDRQAQDSVVRFNVHDLRKLVSIAAFRYNFSLKSYELVAVVGKRGSGHKRTVWHTVLSELPQAPQSQDSESAESVQIPSKSTAIFTLDSVLLFTSSHNGKNLAFLTDAGVIVIALKSFQLASETSFPLEGKITCLAVSNDRVVACARNNGVVTLFFPDKSDAAVSRDLKWHLEPASALCFTRDSSYLLSGGKEKVLVFWKVDSEKHHFLPRLAGPILRICTNGSSSELDSQSADSTDLYTVVMDSPGSLKDEREVVVLNSVELTSRLSVGSVPAGGFKMPKSVLKSASESENVSKIRNPGLGLTGPAALNGHILTVPQGPHLAVYDLARDEACPRLAVASSTQLGKVRSELQIEDPKVSHVCFSGDGAWMATVDALPGSQCALKIWRKQNSNSASAESWELCTKISEPHGAGVDVAQIVSWPGSCGFLSCDLRGGLRLWKPSATQDTIWQLLRYLPSLRSSDSGSACVTVSQDATLVVLALGTALYQIPANSFDSWSHLVLDTAFQEDIISISLRGTQLVAATCDRLCSVDLVASCVKFDFGLDRRLWSLSQNLIVFGEDTFCVATNFLHGPEFGSLAFVFGDSDKPLAVLKYDNCLVSLLWSSETKKYYFVDYANRAGTISGEDSESDTEDVEIGEFAEELAHMVQNVRTARAHEVNGDAKMDVDFGGEEQFWYGKKVGTHTFEGLVHRDLEGIEMEDLFETILSSVSS